VLLQEGGSWQGVLRALYAVEAIVQQGSTAACGEVAVHFQVELALLSRTMSQCLSEAQWCTRCIAMIATLSCTSPHAAQTMFWRSA